ncbi:hypothetical protein B6U99_00855 [Candidatus Geothermarchaeota archaeon ex4572_27]|nr:MAG: hypothetical protein B6U99_00855 [Candidatus Geothermarchaeota archaeon ex4572_27]
MVRPEDAGRLLIECLKSVFGERLLGVMLFGSRARGDYRDDSDYDILVLLSGYAGDWLEEYMRAYAALRRFRDSLGVDTTVLVVSLPDLARGISSSLLLNALFEGIPLHDPSGVLARVKRKLLEKLREMGVTRVKSRWGYTWETPPTTKIPFNINIGNILDPPECEYRLRLAREHLEEAGRALGAGAFIAAAHEAQLSIENSAKAVISLFKPPTWSHNPAPELRRLVEEGRVPGQLRRDVLRLAELAEEAAPHHQLASYGDPTLMRTPGEIYDEARASQLVSKARDAYEAAASLIGRLVGKT